jgi:hypothetical protein
VSHLQGTSQSCQTEIASVNDNTPTTVITASDNTPTTVITASAITDNTPTTATTASAITDNAQTDNAKGVSSDDSHAYCLQAVRDLEANIVQKLCDTMQENFELKRAVLSKDIESLKNENKVLKKEKENLGKELGIAQNELKKCTKKSQGSNVMDKIDQVRLDLTKQLKDRHQIWQEANKKLKDELANLKINESLITENNEKNKQITFLQLQLEKAELAAAKEKENAYEAKIIQLANTVDTSDFIAVKSKGTTKVTDASHSTSSTSTTPTATSSSTSSKPTAMTSKPANKTNMDVPRVQKSYAAACASPPPVDSKPRPRRPDTLNTSTSLPSYSQGTNKPTSPSRGQGFNPNHRSNTSQANKPTVIIIGNSHLHDVNVNRILPKAHVTKIQAYTLMEVADRLENLPFIPNCVVIHEITNDIKSGVDPRACAQFFQSIVDYYATKHPQTKFILSLGLPRTDYAHFNAMTEIVNALLKGGVNPNTDLPFMSGNISFCDHSNFTRNGVPRDHLLDNDGYHLNTEGTTVFSSNIRCKVELVLNIRSSFRRGIQS